MRKYETLIELWRGIADDTNAPDYLREISRDAAVALRELEAEGAELRGVLLRHGFTPCDIPACNCGSWHQTGGFKARFDEIADATDNDWRNGETLCSRVQRIVAERDRLREELAWYGEQARMCRLISSEGDPGRHALQADGGKRARAALEPKDA
jgi:hypothetical protein